METARGHILCLQLFMWDGRFPRSLSLSSPFGCHILTHSKTCTEQPWWAFSSLALGRITEGQTAPSRGFWHTGNVSATYWSGFILLPHPVSCSPAVLFTKRGRPGRRDSQRGGIREGLFRDVHLPWGWVQLQQVEKGLGKLLAEGIPGLVGADGYLGVGASCGGLGGGALEG